MEMQQKLNKLSAKLKGALIFESRQRTREDILNRKIRELFERIETKKKQAFTIHQALLTPKEAQMPFIASILENKIKTSSNVLKISDLITRFLGDKDELAKKVVRFCQSHSEHLNEVTFSLMPSCFRLLTSAESQTEWFHFLEQVFRLDRAICVQLARVCFVLFDVLKVLRFVVANLPIQLIDVRDSETAEQFLTSLLEAFESLIEHMPPILVLLAKSEIGSCVFDQAFLTEMVANPHLYFMTCDGCDHHERLDIAREHVLRASDQKIRFGSKMIDLLKTRDVKGSDTMGRVQKAIPQFESTYFFAKRDLELMEAIMNEDEEVSVGEASYEVTQIHVSGYKVEPKIEDKGTTLEFLLRDLLADSEPGALVQEKFDNIMAFVEMACVEMAPSNLATKQRIRFELFQKLCQKDEKRQFSDILESLEDSIDKSSTGKSSDLLLTYTNLEMELQHEDLIMQEMCEELVSLCKLFFIDCCFQPWQLRLTPEVMRDRTMLVEKVNSLKADLAHFLQDKEIQVPIECAVLLSRIFGLADYNYFIESCPEVLQLNDVFLSNCQSLQEAVERQGTDKFSRKVLANHSDKLAPLARRFAEIFDSDSPQGFVYSQLVTLVSDLNQVLVPLLGEFGADELTPAFHYIAFSSESKAFASRTEYIYRTFFVFYHEWLCQTQWKQREHVMILLTGVFQLILERCEDEAKKNLSWFSAEEQM